MYLTPKIIEISKYALKNGVPQATKKFGIKHNTVERYVRAFLHQREPKILVFDIETSHNIVATFGIKNLYIKPEQVLRQWHLISWSAKWLNSPEIMSDVQTPFEATLGEDKRIVKELSQLINEADIVITYNGNKFDIRRLNTRMLVNGITQPTPVKSIDLYRGIKQKFAFTHSALNEVNKQLGLGTKLDNSGHELWIRCIKGDYEALMEMKKYNEQDTLVTEELYLNIRGWLPQHPNLAVYYDPSQPICRRCGSNDLQLIPNRYITTAIGKYELFQCRKCGTYSRGRKSIDQSILAPIVGY